MDIHITNTGIVSAIGENFEDTKTQLYSGKSGIIQSDYSVSDCDNLPAGQIEKSNEELTAELGLSSDKSRSRTTLLALKAGREAWADQQENSSLRTGLIHATTVGGMDISEKRYGGTIDHEWSVDGQYSCNAAADALAEDLQISDFVTTISTACSSSANAIMMGARMIKAGMLDRVLVGGTDSLCNFTVHGFNALMIYSYEPCRPFDENRKGLNLGEGSAFLLLEGNKSIKATGNPLIGKLVGWSNTNDAYHATASSIDGKASKQAISEALDVAKVQSGDIDYINAHGTGTDNNDSAESNAIISVFGTKIPPFSSTKAMTGHTLAAAGSIEAVVALIAIQEGKLIPSNNWSTPMEDTGLVPVTEQRPAEINTVLSNSFGFGGNNTSLIFSK